MGFPLSFLTGQMTVSNVQQTGSGDVNINMNAVKQLSAQNGQTITGEIIKMEDGNVIMKVGDDLIQARLGSEMDVSVGQNMTFQVQNQNGLVALRALFTNTDISPTTTKALDAAALPINDSTVNLTNIMMKEGMNISPQNLQAMYREVVDHPEASADLLVKMSRLQIPINSDNITQFQNYESMNHELSKSVTQLSDSFMALTNELNQGNPTSEAGLFDTARQVFDVVCEEDLTFFQRELSADEEKLAQALDTALSKGSLAEFVETNPEAANTADAGADFLKQLAGMKNPQAEGSVVDLSKADGKIESNLTGEFGQAEKTAQGLLEEEAKALLKSLPAEKQELMQQLSELGVSAKEMPKLLNASPAQVLTFVSQMLTEAEKLSPKEQTALAKLLTSPAMEKMMNAQLKDVFALKPEDVADKEKVSKLYDAIVEKSAKLSETMSELGKAESAFAQNANNLSQNVHFMQDLNQVMQYIQIPFQMQGKDANGELYVFTNKKSLASEDGSVSAFLHLDMDHLGPTSVYVKMKDANVSTRFYLSDDEVLDFISDNIHILNERLEKRGYHMNASMKVQKEDEPFDVIDSLEKDLKGEGGIGRLLSSHGFDMRA